METTTELTREQRDKRIAVAKDVLLQLGRSDNPLRIMNGRGYVYGNFGVALNATAEIRPHVDAIQSSCSVCAKGALLLSKARLYNAVPVIAIADTYEMNEDGTYESAAASNEDIINALSDVFDPLTLDMIEAAFEKTTIHSGEFEGSGYGVHEDRKIDAAKKFGCRFPSPVDRVAACMNILISNDGEFILPPTP